MKTTIQTFRVGEKEINFFCDQNNSAVIDIDGINFYSLDKILKENPELNNPINLEKLVQIINFISKSLEFHIIENIGSFQQDYRERFDSREVELLDDADDRNSEFFRYDVSGMHAPSIQSGHLVFYTKQDYTGIPYRVVVNYPLEGELSISYQLLPFL